MVLKYCAVAVVLALLLSDTHSTRVTVVCPWLLRVVRVVRVVLVGVGCRGPFQIQQQTDLHLVRARCPAGLDRVDPCCVI